MRTIKILILEDNLKTLSLIMAKLSILEEKIEADKYDIAVTTFSEYYHVERFVNKCSPDDFDIILLDRDCKMGGSFHALDFEKFGVGKIISISTIPEYNEEARKRGVSRVVWKDHDNLDDFAEKLLPLINQLITNLN